MSSSFVIFFSFLYRSCFLCGVQWQQRKETEIPSIHRWQWQIQWDISDNFFQVAASHCEQFAIGRDFFPFEVSLCVVSLLCGANPLNISYCSVFNSLDESEISRESERRVREKIGEISTVWVPSQVISGPFVLMSYKCMLLRSFRSRNSWLLTKEDDRHRIVDRSGLLKREEK